VVASTNAIAAEELIELLRLKLRVAGLSPEPAK
jgi:hypothetical protein